MTDRKYGLGIDISKDFFHVRLLAQPADGGRPKVRGSHKFKNQIPGFEELLVWIDKRVEEGVELAMAMEATGVYHEGLAYFLHDRRPGVSVLLPNKVKAFGRSLNQHSKNDRIDAGLLGRMALERQLPVWEPMSPKLLELRHLNRDRAALIKDRQARRNRLHALRHGAVEVPDSEERHVAAIAFLDGQIAEVTARIKALCRKEAELREATRRLRSVPQVGALTAAAVLGETGGFALFDTREQLIKYAGLDIIERQSGSSVLGPTCISKRGNARLRGGVHMSAVGVIKYPGVFRDVYLRVYGRTRCKMKAIVAVQRKLLVVMFAMVKNGQDYDESVHRLRAEVPDPGLEQVAEPAGAEPVPA